VKGVDIECRFIMISWYCLEEYRLSLWRRMIYIYMISIDRVGAVFVEIIILLRMKSMIMVFKILLSSRLVDKLIYSRILTKRRNIIRNYYHAIYIYYFIFYLFSRLNS